MVLYMILEFDLSESNSNLDASIDSEDLYREPII